MSQTPALEDVILAAMDERLEAVYTARPGIVQAYDRATQTASIQPAVRTAHLGELGQRVTESMPVHQVVPVSFPSGGGFRITWPLKVGDTGLLVFLDCSSDRWVSEGGEVDPGDDRRHAAGSAFFVPGGRSLKQALKSVAASALSLGHDNGNTIDITDTGIYLGGSDATDLLMRKSDATAFMTALAHAITDIVATNPDGAGALAALADRLAHWLDGIDSIVRSK